MRDEQKQTPQDVYGEARFLEASFSLISCYFLIIYQDQKCW